MRFSSNEELLIAARDLISGLKARGADESANILHDGFCCITGLIDGWALFLDAIIEIQEKLGHQLRENEKPILKDLHDAVYKMVYGRKPKWWKFWIGWPYASADRAHHGWYVPGKRRLSDIVMSQSGMLC